MKKLYFITGNKGKVTEAKKKLEQSGVTIAQKDLGYPEIQAETLEEVARYGAETVRKRWSHPFILEDAGLFIDALEGFPGVYSKYVFFTIGLDGVLKLLDESNERTALFRSVYAYASPEREPVLFVGECPGTIINEKRGRGGFGYDPIFVPDRCSKTFAEMTPEEKNKWSHRGKALEKLYEFLKKGLI